LGQEPSKPIPEMKPKLTEPIVLCKLEPDLAPELTAPILKVEPKLISTTTPVEFKPYTAGELASFPLRQRQQMIFERTLALREQETAKTIINDLLHIQAIATHDEKRAQHSINKVDTQTKEMISKGGLGQTVKESELKIDQTNVSQDPAHLEVSDDSDQSDDESIDNDVEGERQSIAVVERPIKRPADSLKHASSEPKKGTKRVVAEAIAPTDKIDKRPPKRSKSADGTPVPRKTAKENEKCSHCNHGDPKWC